MVPRFGLNTTLDLRDALCDLSHTLPESASEDKQLVASHESKQEDLGEEKKQRGDDSEHDFDTDTARDSAVQKLQDIRHKHMQTRQKLYPAGDVIWIASVQPKDDSTDDKQPPKEEPALQQQELNDSEPGRAQQADMAADNGVVVMEAKPSDFGELLIVNGMYSEHMPGAYMNAITATVDNPDA